MSLLLKLPSPQLSMHPRLLINNVIFPTERRKTQRGKREVWLSAWRGVKNRICFNNKDDISDGGFSKVIPFYSFVMFPRRWFSRRSGSLWRVWAHWPWSTSSTRKGLSSFLPYLKVHKHDIFCILFCRNRNHMVPRAFYTSFLKILFDSAEIFDF